MYILSHIRIVKDERGALTPLMLSLFIGIILMTGISLDLIRQETERSDLQDALDRGVLAATAITQTVEAELTINDYLAKRPFSTGELNVAVVSEGTGNSRLITADADYQMSTIFLRMTGLDELSVPASSAAIQSVRDLEVSLILDISGSMARELSSSTGQSRLSVLRAAASGFVDEMLTDISTPSTSISLIPYSGQVNAGPLFDYFNTTRVHNYSSCIEFADSDFNTTSLPAAVSRAQVPQFQWFRFEANYGFEAEWGWCPNDNQPIVPLSNDADALKDSIADFVGHDGTGTQIGLKWGLGLLDPSSQPIVQTLVNAGTVDPAFANRPAAFEDTTRVKAIVLMTDGNIRYQQRPKASAYDTESERITLATASNYLYSSKATLGDSGQRTADEAAQTALFQSLCALAKQNGVVVFTIGFDISTSSSAYTEMRDCASSYGHFYDVQGLELNSAFDQIAGILSKLKLIE